MSELEKLIAVYRDPSVYEMMINDDGGVFVERAGAALERVDAAPGQEEILEFVRGVAGSPEAFGSRRPYADLSAIDGSRIHVISPPIVKGLTVTLRKLPSRRPTLRQLVDGGALSDKAAGFLDYCVQRKMNIMVVGGTSSGKTTLLAALAALTDPEERMLVLEDTPELALPSTHRHVLHLRTQLSDAAGSPEVSLRELVINTLRMRPDRVIVGETRGPEAADMLQAMNVGNDGMMTTLHANSAREAISRLETLVLQSGMDMPLKAIRQSIVSALDVIVFLARLPDGSRRVVQIAEVTGLEVEMVSMVDLFLLDRRQGGAQLRSAGTMPRFYERLRLEGEEPPLQFFRDETHG